MEEFFILEALNTNNHTFEVSPAFMVIEQALIKYITNLFGWGDQVLSLKEIWKKQSEYQYHRKLK